MDQHCWGGRGESKLESSLRAIWQNLVKLRMRIHYKAAISLQGDYPRNS